MHCLVSSGHGFAVIGFRPCRVPDFVGLGVNMSSIGCARTAYVDIAAKRIYLGVPLVSAAGVRKIIRLFTVVLGAASLAACAQSSVVTKNSELLAGSRQASLEHDRKTSFVTD